VPDNYQARMPIADANSYGDVYADSSSNGYGYGYGDGNSHSNGYGDCNGNAYGFTNAYAVPIAHNGLLSAGGHERCSQHRQGRFHGAVEV